uniref:Uncharacterized protein LOC101500960 n=1 Tax=Cicer arietinum TaxID=3827 RepID=A0A1S3E558_CICAR|nr:uncharacterized protein LOC101500960 [Cicer arietinum]
MAHETLQHQSKRQQPIQFFQQWCEIKIIIKISIIILKNLLFFFLFALFGQNAPPRKEEAGKQCRVPWDGQHGKARSIAYKNGLTTKTNGYQIISFLQDIYNNLIKNSHFWSGGAVCSQSYVDLRGIDSNMIGAYPSIPRKVKQLKILSMERIGLDGATTTKHHRWK